MPVTVTEPKSGQPVIDVVDNLPHELRELVHDYGYSVIHQFVMFGIKSPSKVRSLIRAVHQGAREPGNKRNGKPTATMGLDNWLVVHGAPVSARMVIRALRDHGYTVLPLEPTVLMENAAENTPGKMKKKVSAALLAGDREAWGDL